MSRWPEPWYFKLRFERAGCHGCEPSSVLPGEGGSRLI